jgi:hypothetical protein
VDVGEVMFHTIGLDIGISDERERWLWSEYVSFFEGKVYVSPIDVLQYVVCHPEMTTAERVYMAFVVGATCDPAVAGEWEKINKIG